MNKEPEIEWVNLTPSINEYIAKKMSVFWAEEIMQHVLAMDITETQKKNLFEKIFEIIAENE